MNADTLARWLYERDARIGDVSSRDWEHACALGLDAGYVDDAREALALLDSGERPELVRIGMCVGSYANGNRSEDLLLVRPGPGVTVPKPIGTEVYVYSEPAGRAQESEREDDVRREIDRWVAFVVGDSSMGGVAAQRLHDLFRRLPGASEPTEAEEEPGLPHRDTDWNEVAEASHKRVADMQALTNVVADLMEFSVRDGRRIEELFGRTPTESRDPWNEPGVSLTNTEPGAPE